MAKKQTFFRTKSRRDPLPNLPCSTGKNIRKKQNIGQATDIARPNSTMKCSSGQNNPDKSTQNSNKKIEAS